MHIVEIDYYTHVSLIDVARLINAGREEAVIMLKYTHARKETCKMEKEAEGYFRL
jgi:hypothetical protein